MKCKILNWLEKVFMRTDGKQDYCTCAPDVVMGVDIGECCMAHDEHYNLKNITKEEADLQFRENIKIKFEEAGKKYRGKIIAWIYWKAVVRHGNGGQEW